jgi:hypothetical protein
MANQRKIIGRIPVYRGEWTIDNSPYHKLNDVTLYGCTFRSKIESNSYPPATIGSNGELVVNENWSLISSGYESEKINEDIAFIDKNSSAYNVSRFHIHSGFWEAIEYDESQEAYMEAKEYASGSKVNLVNYTNYTFVAKKAMTGIQPDINNITNKFTLEEAVLFVPNKYQLSGLDIGFISSDTNKPVFHRYNGGLFTSILNWTEDVYEKLTELEDSFSSSVFFKNNKLNNLFKEIYLSGNGFDKTHNYYIYSVLRNYEGTGWAISIKDANTQESTGWIVFSSEEEIKGYVKVVKGGYTVEAILSDWSLFVDSQTNFEQNDSILNGNQFDISFSPAIKGIHENNDLLNKYDKISESVLQNRNVICKISNLFDFGESGKFINQEGNIATGEEYYKISSYQKVSEGDILLFTGKYQTTSYFNALYGYEDENRKNPIALLDWSGDAEYVNKEVVIPAGINYIQGWNDTRKNANPILRFKTEQESINTDLYDKIQSIEKNTGSHIAIYVDKNGEGDFTSFVDAIKSIKDSSNDKIYDVYINEGEYDIVSEYFGEQDYTDSTDKGLNIPDYVNLIGLGDRDKIVLKGEMPDTIKYSTSQYYSTINIQYNNNLENLTVTAYNCRYPVHDQTTAKSKDCVRNVKNCIFIHKGYNGTPYTGSVDAEHNTTQYRWGSAHAYGQGTNSGSYCSFDYCHFDAQGNTGSAFLTHDDSAAVKGTKIIITNCQFNNKGTSDLIQISALGAKNCIITFVGNKFDGNKTIKCANSSINQSQKFNYYLYGYGNSECVISVPEGEEGKDNIIQ